MRWFTLLLLALALVACKAGTAPAPTSPPTSAAPAEAAQPIPAGTATIHDVAIPAADGLELAGTLYPGQGEGPHAAVLLLHMLNSRRTVWNDFATRLAGAGYTALALDMRGHGDTGGKKEWDKARDDLQRAWQFLIAQPEVDRERTAVVGASIGANMSLIAGADQSQIKTVVLLSPGLEYQGVSTVEAITNYGDRPALIVASRDDAYAADSSRQLAELALNAGTQLLLYDDAGHGTNMFGPRPDLADTILAWLGQQLGPASGR